jgi:hypothetical protein
MGENDIVAAALCMASPFCAVAGLLSGLVWRIHFSLGLVAVLGTAWFLTIGVLPIMLLPTVAAAIVWTAIGSGLARLFFGNRHRLEETLMAGGKAPISERARRRHLRGILDGDLSVRRRRMEPSATR